MRKTTISRCGAWAVASLTVALLALPLHATVDSGSICATNPSDPRCLGDVTYAVSTEVALPADGVLHYGTLTIPAGVTITFAKNTVNTPVFVLASGDVTIAGDINVNATAGAAVGIYGDGNIGDDGNPGLGGNGGYAGGAGGIGGSYGGAAWSPGGSGMGVGGGGGGPGSGSNINTSVSGGGGGFGTAGGQSCYQGGCSGAGGLVYGQDSLMPLVGGSGGGGGCGGTNFTGSGGGGGGGAILLASSGTIQLSGRILAQGQPGGAGSYGITQYGGCGGGGSGGAVRLIATTINGGGTVYAQAGAGGCGYSGGGGNGRIRFEFENYGFTGPTYPAKTVGDPGSIFVPNNPTLRITTVGGTAIPSQPTGSADATFPSDVVQPITITIQASQIPLGTTVTVWVKPQTGTATSYLSTALDGTVEASTATVDVTFPPGPSVLEASASFTLVLEGAAAASLKYDDEAIKSAEVRAAANGQTEVFYVTQSGKRIPEAKVGPLAYAMARTGARN